MRDIYRSERSACLLFLFLTFLEFTDYENYIELGPKHENAITFKQFIDTKFSLDRFNGEAAKFSFEIPVFEYDVKYPNHLLTTITNKKGAPISPVKRRKGMNIEIIEDIVGLIDFGMRSLKEGTYSEKLVTPWFRIQSFYPVQFEALRLYSGVSLANFILSLSFSHAWEDNNGGKTGASFIKTFDQRYVAKEIDKKEFTMLISFLPAYFEYIWSSTVNKKTSLLVRLYGVYEIQDEKKTSYYLLMENLFFGLAGKNLKVYDLKGSELNRYLQKSEGGSQTLLDTNFRIERNGEPLPVRFADYDRMLKGVKTDTEFLALNKKIDYSLLLIFNEETGIMRGGIIDFLRNYDLEKQLEHVGKKIIKGGVVPTVTGPVDYKERFRNAMKTYFMPVHQQ